MPYQFRTTNRFKKAFKKKTLAHKELVERALENLSKDPRHPGLNVHKVQGTAGIWECYVNDAHRITFEYVEGDADQWILLRNNCKHDTVLRPPF